MPAKCHGPYLYLRKPHNGGAVWIIRDRQKYISVSDIEGHEMDKAQAALDLYRENLGLGPDVKRDERPQQIYFASTDDVPDYPIKIGLTTEGRALFRMSNMQTACPYKLVMLALIPVFITGQEGMIHGLFAATRLQGEWFARSPELLGYIDGLLKTHGAHFWERATQGSQDIVWTKPRGMQNEEDSFSVRGDARHGGV